MFLKSLSRPEFCTYLCTIPWNAPVDWIWHTCEGVEDVEDPLIGTDTGGVTITMYLSGNGSGQLVRVDGRWVTRRIVQNHSIKPEGLRSTYHNYFRPRGFRYERQPSLLHPSEVGLSQWIHNQFIKDFFPKRRGNYWWIVEVSVIFCARFFGRACLFLFAQFFVVSFARDFVRTFLIYTRVSIAFIFHLRYHLVILRTWAYIFVVNVYTIETLIIYIQTIICTIQKLKALCVPCKISVHFKIFVSNSIDTSLIEYDAVHACPCVEWQMFCLIYKYQNNCHINSQFHHHVHSQFLPLSNPNLFVSQSHTWVSLVR